MTAPDSIAWFFNTSSWEAEPGDRADISTETLRPKHLTRRLGDRAIALYETALRRTREFFIAPRPGTLAAGACALLAVGGVAIGAQEVRSTIHQVVAFVEGPSLNESKAIAHGVEVVSAVTHKVNKAAHRTTANGLGIDGVELTANGTPNVTVQINTCAEQFDPRTQKTLSRAASQRVTQLSLNILASEMTHTAGVTYNVTRVCFPKESAPKSEDDMMKPTFTNKLPHTLVALTNPKA